MDNLTKIDQVIALLAGGLFLAVLAFVGWKLYQIRRRIRHAERKEAEQDPPEAEPIIQNLRLLRRTLARAEDDERAAGIHLTDAKTYTQNLVNLIQAIVLKAESMAQEVESLQAALEAIAGGDPLEIARAAGNVEDTHIRTLMLCNVRDAGYWQDTARVIAAHVGTLSQWQRGYRAFSSNLLAEVSKAKSQLTAQAAALELTGTAGPLLQAQANLAQAQRYLQLETKPGLYEAAKTLPAVNAGLLTRGTR